MILLYKNEPTIAANNKQKILVMDGAKITTSEAFYTLIKNELSLPDYFGNNLDALSDSLTDLPHLNIEELIVILKNQSAFLSEESIELKNELLETLIFSVDELDLLKEEDSSYDTPYIFLYLENTKNNLDFLNAEAVPFEEL